MITTTMNMNMTITPIPTTMGIPKHPPMNPVMK